MKTLFTLFILSLTLGLGLTAYAQNFRSKQKSQERIIKSAYKHGKITEREYYKLIDEQAAIEEAIAKYEADKILTPHEKNVLHDKLVRAEKRLRRYKTNGEVY